MQRRARNPQLDHAGPDPVPAVTSASRVNGQRPVQAATPDHEIARDRKRAAPAAQPPEADPGG